MVLKAAGPAGAMDNMFHPNQSRPPLCPTSATLIALPCLYTLLFLTGLPGNVLSLWVSLRRISPTAPTQVYLSHLSVSNLLVSLTTPFMAMYYTQAAAQPTTSILCQLVLHVATPVLHVNIHLAVLLLTWVALSRLAVLTRRTLAGGGGAFFSCLRRASFARGVCVGSWVVVGGVTTSVTLYYSVKEIRNERDWADGGHGGAVANSSQAWDERDQEKEEVALCYRADTELGGNLSAAGQVTAITIFFACLLLVLLCYVLLFVHIRRLQLNAKMATTTKGLHGRVLCNIFVIKFKNFVLLLAVLRSSLDPGMYFMLDRTFRNQTLILLRLKPQTSTSEEGRAAELPRPSQLGSATPAGDWFIDVRCSVACGPEPDTSRTMSAVTGQQRRP
ncbi:hypothetical protein CRUP_038701 [Coryphaenoides rupestris]|nr:hypothetical protein CRUP_038701 [Coryphaenoides rupestris]